MSKSLTEIAQQLKDSDKKIQLLYAFNGSGKTRLSREFKDLIAPKNTVEESGDESDQPRNKILYYNAYTEDLFYWDNDLDYDTDPKLKIQSNSFTDWLISLLQELGEDGNIVTNFQRYTNSKVTPIFNEEYKQKIKDHDGKEVEITIPAFSEITFQVATNNPDESADLPNDENNVIQGKYENIKISKGEESNFIWSYIYTLLEQAVLSLNEQDKSNRITDKFNQLEYVFIDDPVSSLDDSHLIELAVDLATLIKMSTFVDGNGLKFIITTHSPLFYNVLYNELNNDLKNSVKNGDPAWLYKRNQSKMYRMEKKADGTYELISSNDHPFSYHLFLFSEINNAIKNDQIEKYHFSFLRNILEKTATFLGHKSWQNLLKKTSEGIPDPFANRILNLSSHSAHAGEEVTNVEDKDKENIADLMEYIIKTYGFEKQEVQND